MVSTQTRTNAAVKLPGHCHEVDGLVLPRACGGHPALDFVNTYAGWHELSPRGWAREGEYLRSYDHLAVWVVEAGLLDRAAAEALRRRAANRRGEAEAVVARARTFRRHLREAVFAPTDARKVARVDATVRDAAASVSLLPARAGAGPSWSVGGGLERPLHAVAWAAADLLTTVPLDAVRSCPGDHCGWLFLSPSGRRKWCSMQWCGNRAKVAAHAARHRVGS
jgi:predicted RNA-binding Zn ribbon-like protein